MLYKTIERAILGNINLKYFSTRISLSILCLFSKNAHNPEEDAEIEPQSILKLMYIEICVSSGKHINFSRMTGIKYIWEIILKLLINSRFQSIVDNSI